MKILITGASGFIGKNLQAELKNRNYTNILIFETDTDISLLDEYCKVADFVFHLAGVNRPKEQSDYMKGNYEFTSTVTKRLKQYNNKCPIIFSSSIQAAFPNLYGKSKKSAEKLLIDYSEETGVKILIYRLPNVFGKWCKPNYNSAVATFCHNIARGVPIRINDSNAIMNLVYIDDVVKKMVDDMEEEESRNGIFAEVTPVYAVSLGEVVELIESFKKSRELCLIPNMSNEFIRKLYSTYLSYIPEKEFNYELKMLSDERGSFTEYIKMESGGQVSVNISKPGMVKGNHWHQTKSEKFLVVNGEGVIRFRRIDSDEVVEYFVSGRKLEVIDVPVGYTHNIENLGNDDMVTLIWANEIFDPDQTDTYGLDVGG